MSRNGLCIEHGQPWSNHSHACNFTSAPSLDQSIIKLKSQEKARKRQSEEPMKSILITNGID